MRRGFGGGRRAEESEVGMSVKHGKDVSPHTNASARVVPKHSSFSL